MHACFENKIGTTKQKKTNKFAANTGTESFPLHLFFTFSSITPCIMLYHQTAVAKPTFQMPQVYKTSSSWLSNTHNACNIYWFIRGEGRSAIRTKRHRCMQAESTAHDTKTAPGAWKGLQVCGFVESDRTCWFGWRFGDVDVSIEHGCRWSCLSEQSVLMSSSTYVKMTANHSLCRVKPNVNVFIVKVCFPSR